MRSPSWTQRARRSIRRHPDFGGPSTLLSGNHGNLMDETMIRGSCICGGIKFEIQKVVALTHCHCSVCRKESGASFATFAHVRRERFRLVAGEDLINSGYEWTPGHAVYVLRCTCSPHRR